MTKLKIQVPDSSIDNWIQCASDCGRQRNFTNGIEGLRNNGQYTGECSPGAWNDVSDPEEGLRVDPDAASIFKINVKEWYATQEYPVVPEGLQHPSFYENKLGCEQLQTQAPRTV